MPLIPQKCGQETLGLKNSLLTDYRVRTDTWPSFASRDGSKL